METLFDRLYHELQAGQPAVLLTVVASQGSTPRGIGSHQAVFADGTTAGTVGGGYQEYLAIQAGKQCLAQQQSAFRRLILHPNDEEDINAACGGELTVFFRPCASRRRRGWLSMSAMKGNGAWPWYGKGLYKAAARWAPCRLSMPPGAGRT